MNKCVTFIFTCLLLSSFDFCLGELYSVRYNIMKSNIATLLNTGTTRSVFTEGIAQIASTLASTADQTTLNNWVTNVENDIIQNPAVTPAATKISKLATQLDVLFIQNPTIQKSIIHRNISTWGPVANFQYITDEDNIDYFWELSSTAGTAGCKIYDILLDLTKDNPAVQKRIYLKGTIPCYIGWAMVTRMANMIYDVPVSQRTYLLTLILPNGISFNQYIRIARAYYPTTLRTCGRILQTNANFVVADITLTLKSQAKQLLNYLITEFTPDKTTDDCISIASNRVVYYLDFSSTYLEAYIQTVWEPPFGSLFEIIVFNDCQLPVLKSKAPTYFP